MVHRIRGRRDGAELESQSSISVDWIMVWKKTYLEKKNC